MSKNNESTRKNVSQAPTLPKLPTLSRPFVINHEDFIFEDPYESDPEKYGITLADSDDEALKVLNGAGDVDDDEDEEESVDENDGKLWDLVI